MMNGPARFKPTTAGLVPQIVEVQIDRPQPVARCEGEFPAGEPFRLMIVRWYQKAPPRKIPPRKI
jgi:hypothetical protein